MKCLAVLSLITVFVLPSFAQNSFKFESGKSKTVIPFELINNLIFIPVHVNGVKLNFMLDSGIEETILFSLDDSDDISFENVQSIRLRGLGNKDYVQGLKSSNNKLELPGLFAEDHVIYIILEQDFNFSSNIGIPVNGIIGHHFFKDYFVEINYDRKKIIVYKDARKIQKRIKRQFTAIPISLELQKPYLMTQIIQQRDTVNAKLLIDTGSSDALWIFRQQSDLISLPESNFDDFLGRGFSGDINGKRARIPKFRIKDFEFDDLLAAFPDSVSISNIKMVDNRVGSVGGEILRRFKIVFDYKTGFLYLKKGTHFDDPFNYNMSGIELRHDGLQWVKETVQLSTSQIVSSYDIKSDQARSFKYKFALKPVYSIFAIRPGSPAELAGLQVGDILLSINNTNAYRYSLQQINSLLKSEEGKMIEIRVERENKVLDFKFQLQRIL